jgi:hypothetical protein
MSNHRDIVSADPPSMTRVDGDGLEYHGVRITAIVSAVAVVVWTAICVLLALARLDTSSLSFTRNSLAFAGENLGERFLAASAALHKATRHVLAPTLAASETTGAVNSELPLAIKVTNYTPGTSINLSGLVEGTTLSSGAPGDDGQWRIAIDDLPITRVIPPPEYVGPMTLVVELRNDDDHVIVHIPLRLTWRRDITGSNAGIENSDALATAAPVVDEAPESALPEEPSEKNLIAVPPQPAPPIHGSVSRPEKNQRVAKKRRHRTSVSESEAQTSTDPRSDLPVPFIGDFFANAGTTRERKPAWSNDVPDIIDRSWERCREPFDCRR